MTRFFYVRPEDHGLMDFYYGGGDYPDKAQVIRPAGRPKYRQASWGDPLVVMLLVFLALMAGGVFLLALVWAV